MKVLHVIPSVSAKRGGPSKAIISMVRALRESGIDAEIATTNDDGSELLDVTLNELSDHHEVPVRFFSRLQNTLTPLREFSFSNTFRHWLKQNIERYDLIHVHAIFSFTSSYTLWLARKRGVPYVIRPIGQLEHWSLAQSALRKKLFLALFERKNMACAAAIQFTAMSEKSQAIDRFPELASIAQVIPLGIQVSDRDDQARHELCRRYQINPSHRVLLFLSRLHPKKGLELLLDSLSLVATNEWALLIAGDGEPDYMASLEAHCNSLGLTRQCQFIGYRTGADKAQLLAGADIFTLTSYSENFGIAALEAMSHGTPVLLSKEVALADFVKEHRAGWVTDLNKDAIRQTITNCLSAETPNRNAIRAAISQHFSWPKISETLTELYQSIARK